jgi:hypothetical protein
MQQISSTGRFPRPSVKAQGCNALVECDDEGVNAGKTIRFSGGFGQGFFPFAAAGNSIVAIFKGVL